MSDIIITVENLSKAYSISHQQANDKYRSIRESIYQQAASLPVKFKGMLSGKQSFSGEITEEFWALKDISFEVKKGEVLGIIGRNGAGKSTLLKILSRITEPTAGRVILKGRVASLLEVGTGFHPELTGRENIFLNGAILGMKKKEIRQKFDEIVDFSGVERFLDTPVKRYSSGMYVRLAFAVAAHLEPEVLVVDEVLAVGDADFQKKCMGKMQAVADSGRTVLFVSHDLNAINRLCTQGLLLNQGKILAIGDIKNVITAYRSNSEASDQFWSVPNISHEKPLQFSRLEILKEISEDYVLELNIELQSNGFHKPGFIAVDLHDPTGNCLMQIIPTHTGFLTEENKHHSIQLKSHLPPLVPGEYSLSFWAGPHNTETLDYVENKISFNVLTSPCPGRTFPHSAVHGYIIASSTFQYSPLSNDSEMV